MRAIAILFLVFASACGTDNLPQVTSAIIQRPHVNDPRSALYQDLVPRNSVGTVTALAGGVGSTTFPWATSFFDGLLLGDPLDLNKVNSTGQNLIFETNDIIALTLNSSQETEFGPTSQVILGDSHIRDVSSFVIIVDSDNDSTTDLFRLMKDSTTVAGATEILTISEQGVFAWSAGAAAQYLSPASHSFTIDQDDNGANDSFLIFGNNGQKLIHIQEDTGTADGVRMVIGGATPVTNEVLKVCLSADCSAQFTLFEEGSPTHMEMVYDDGTSNNGLLIQNEDTSPSGTDMLQLDFSNDSDVSGEDFVTFQDLDGEIGSIRALTAASVAFNTTSDARLKHNERPIKNALEILMTVGAYEFEWNEDGAEDRGFYAQQLDKVYPFAVSGNPNGDPHESPMGVDYGKLTPLLVAAVQELKKQNDNLKVEIENLKRGLR